MTDTTTQPPPSFPDFSKPSPVMVERLEQIRADSAARVAAGAEPPRWVPTRLMLINYWHFGIQEFHLADGRIVMSGANASGKSTVLAAGIPLGLDGDKHPQRMDPFGGKGRNVAYYLVGSPTDGPDSDLYYQDRTAYIAWEFWHPAPPDGTPAFKTIGIGMRGRRGEFAAEASVDAWGFAITDGRRLGIDLALTTNEPEPVPLTKRQLRDVLGANPVVEKTSDYQALVNQELYGFDTVEQFKFLMNIVVQLRSPKLNKDLKPDEVCRMLTESLPPLSEELLTQVAQIIEDIDAYTEELKFTADHLERVTALDAAQAAYLNQEAQRVAVHFRREQSALDIAETDLATLERDATEREHALESTRQQLDALETERIQVAATLHTRKNHALYSSVGQLELAKQEWEEARAAERRAERAVTEADGGRTRRVGRIERTGEEWDGAVYRVREELALFAEDAAGAEWPDAMTQVETVRAALAHATVSTGILPAETVQLEALSATGETRQQHLREVATRLHKVEEAEQAYALAQTTLNVERGRLAAATDTVRDREQDLEAAQDAAAAAVAAWHRRIVECRLPVADLNTIARAIAAYTDHTVAPRTLLAPIDRSATTREAAIREEQLLADEDRRVLLSRKQHLERDLHEWQVRTGAEPPPRPGQIAVREALAARGIPAVPLYAATDVRDGIPEPIAAALETALEDAGLLDALVLPLHQVADARAVVATLSLAGGADRWLAVGDGHDHALAQDGETLAAYLVGVPGALDTADIGAALRAIRVVRQMARGDATDGGDGARTWVSPTGEYGVGLLEGQTATGERERPRYLGETNRRREREAAIARLSAEVAAVADEIAIADAILAEHAARIERVRVELHDALALPELARLQEHAVKLWSAKEDLQRQQVAVERADAKARAVFEALTSARAFYQRALEPVEEARGRTREQVLAMVNATGAVIRDVRTVKGLLARFGEIRQQYTELMQDLEEAIETLARAQDAQHDARDRVTQLATRCAAIEEQLQAEGLDALLAEVSSLERRLTAIDTEKIKHVADVGRYEQKLTDLRQNAEQAKTRVQTARDRVNEVTRSLESALTAYPTMTSELALCRSGPHGPRKAADELLKLRRTEDETDLERAVEDRLRRLHGELSTRFSQARSPLVEYHPEFLDNRLVQFRHNGQRVTAYRLKEELAHHKRQQEIAIREKENALYENFLLKDVASAIRQAIEVAQQSTDRVNEFLAKVELSNHEVLSITWSPVQHSEVGRANYTDLVRLIAKDPAIMPRAELDWITEFFRARMAEVREAERQGRAEGGFAAMLKRVLDYRRWFEFRLWSKMPNAKRLELTPRRFEQRSGAEKSLAMFIPLLAAVDARYAGARPDAPRLIGIDEAFAGVDEQNTTEMFKFLVHFGFSWCMTSEKLWGVSPALPACTTYKLTRDGSVVLPWLFLWDGRTRHADDALPGGSGAPSAANGTYQAMRPGDASLAH